MTWNFDISQAPLGKIVTKTVAAGRDADGNPKTKLVEERVPDFIWAASNCGKVLKSYWLPATKHHNGFWEGFPSNPKYGSGPVAWQPFVVPEHPSVTRAKALDELGELDGALLAFPIIEDVGGE